MSRAERDARYNRSEKGRARHRKYNATEKGIRRNTEWYEGLYYPEGGIATLTKEQQLARMRRQWADEKRRSRQRVERNKERREENAREWEQLDTRAIDQDGEAA